MDREHRNSTFIQFVSKLLMSIKTIENEKLHLMEFKDFNLNDAFKILARHKKQYPNTKNKADKRATK